MSPSIAQAGSQPRVLALWARVEISTIAAMAIAVVLCARPLLQAPGEALEDVLAATGNAFAAFIIAELVCMPFATWFGEARSRAFAWPVVALGLVSTMAAIDATSAAVRALCYGLAGAGAEAARAWIAGSAVRSPLLRRGPELLAIAATCAAALALVVGLYVAASGPPQGIRTLVVCCAGQATVIVLAVLHALHPPSPSTSLAD
jgi:hypothetical protein